MGGGPRGPPVPVVPPPVGSAGLLRCARPWGPCGGRSGPLCGPSLAPSGLRPAPAVSSLAPARWAGGGRRGSVGPGRPSAPFGSLRWPRATAAPPAPVARFRAPPRAPSPARPAGRARRVRALGWLGGRPWPAPCSLWSPCAALRPPPPPSGPSRVPPALHPLRVPSGPSGGRPPGVRAPPAGRGWRPCGPPFRLRPARRGEGCHCQASPARVETSGQRLPLPGLSCLRQMVGSPPKGGLTSSNACATMMEQGRPALYRQPFGCPLAVVEGGRFFAFPSRPPPSGGGAQGHGDAAHPPPSATGGDEGPKRGVRTKLSAPLWRILVSRSHSTKRPFILLSSLSKFIAAPSRGRLLQESELTRAASIRPPTK